MAYSSTSLATVIAALLAPPPLAVLVRLTSAIPRPIEEPLNEVDVFQFLSG